MKNLLAYLLIATMSSCSTVYYKGNAYEPVYSDAKTVLDSTKAYQRIYSASEIGISSKNNLSRKKKIVGYTKRKVTKGEKIATIGLLTTGAVVTAVAIVVAPFFLFYMVIKNSEQSEK